MRWLDPGTTRTHWGAKAQGESLQNQGLGWFRGSERNESDQAEGRSWRKIQAAGSWRVTNRSRSRS